MFYAIYLGYTMLWEMQATSNRSLDFFVWLWSPHCYVSGIHCRDYSEFVYTYAFAAAIY